MDIDIKSADEMLSFGQKVGALLRGGEVLVLSGDVGAGKTTFTKGLAVGLGVSEEVQSPTFTISRIYQARDGLVLAHYDFYRLTSPGVLKMELAETVGSLEYVTVIEWGGIIESVLPSDKLELNFTALAETERRVNLKATGTAAARVIEGLGG